MVIDKDDILMLRTWRAADAASLAANADDITLWNNVRDLFPHPYTLADAREFIAAAAGKPCPVDFAVCFTVHCRISAVLIVRLQA